MAAAFPENEWVTVTSSVEHLGGGTYDLRLFLNGREVDAIVGVTGTPITNAHPFLIGKGFTTDDVAFDGELDDIWVADGVHTGDWLTSNWHTCSTAPASPHVFEQANGSAPAGVTFTPRAPTFP
ncbi:MAG: LamG-like jellyroll fold domain-containing protein [Polyangiaceae bacterium]